MKPKRPLLIFLVAILAVCLINLAIGIRRYSQELETAGWPAVAGQVLEKRVEQYQFGKTHYRPCIKYQYKVRNTKEATPGQLLSSSFQACFP